MLNEKFRYFVIIMNLLLHVLDQMPTSAYSEIILTQPEKSAEIPQKISRTVVGKSVSKRVFQLVRGGVARASHSSGAPRPSGKVLLAPPYGPGWQPRHVPRRRVLPR